MSTTVPVRYAKVCICIAAAAACAVLSGPIQAEERLVALQISVSTAGLDLTQPADARELYGRLHKAAVSLCGINHRVDLLLPTNFASCYEHALGEAVRSANRPQLTLVYMRTHSLQDAANRGIEIPTLVVAK